MPGETDNRVRAVLALRCKPADRKVSRDSTNAIAAVHVFRTGHG